MSMQINYELAKQREFIRKIRKSRDLPQSQFAKLLGVAKGYISKIEVVPMERPPDTFFEKARRFMTAEEKAIALDLMIRYYQELLK